MLLFQYIERGRSEESAGRRNFSRQKVENGSFPAGSGARDRWAGAALCVNRWLAIAAEIVRIGPMKELRRSNDLVYVSWVRATLEADGIDCVVLDEHISGIEGGINAFPRRIMVNDDVFDDAKRLLQLAEAELNGA
jgi:hypothetical protein